MKKKYFGDVVFTLIGSLIWAVALNTFMVPNLIASGGLAGLATVLKHFFNLPVGTMIIVMNIPIFIWAFIKMGWKLVIRILVVMVVSSVILDISDVFLPVFTEDKLLSAIFGGVLCGIGLGLIYQRGLASGGTDLLAMLIDDYLPFISYGRMILILDLGVIIIASIAFQDWQSALYSAISLYITGVIVDNMLEGLNTGKMVYIISEKQDEIAGQIMKKLERGVTSLNGRGCYTGKEKDVLITVLRRYEIHKVKEIVKGIDENAFVIVGDVSEVAGEGFNTAKM